MSGGNAYKRKSHRRIEVITSVAAVVVLYVILESFGVTCPIKYITGISCAGCGMSRAWISLLHFNIHDAFMYHPLFFLPPVVVIVMLFKSKINIKIYKIFMFTMAGAFVCGIGPFIAMHILIKNSNKICNAYNRAHGLI